MFSTETIERLLKVIPHNELYSSPIKGLFLRHSDQPFCYEGIIQEPSICIVLSGEREVQLGEQCYRFDNQHFMFCPVNIPMRGEIKYAEPQKPFLVMSMKIDIESVSKILLANPNLADDVQQGDEGFVQWHLDESLKNAVADNESLGRFLRMRSNAYHSFKFATLFACKESIINFLLDKRCKKLNIFWIFVQE